MRILFVDPVCPKPYDPEVLATQPLGGTEATVIRVAKGLAERGAYIEVTQHCRQLSLPTTGGMYTQFGFSRLEAPTHVVVLRAPMALYQARKQFPHSKLYLWLHDMVAGPGWVEGFKAIQDTRAVVITVSAWHRSQMYDAAERLGVRGSIPSERLYNPVADDLVPDGTPVDANKLVFFSSPHKGLEHTLKVFERFQDFEELREMRLYIANPGYFADAETEGLRNVVNLGALPHAAVISHVRSALGVFHLNGVYPETFGLVHAEANAVGTPFLSSRLGATPEIADHPGELIDVNDPKAVIDRIRQWTAGRPKVRCAGKFRLSHIVREWMELLR